MWWPLAGPYDCLQLHQYAIQRRVIIELSIAVNLATGDSDHLKKSLKRLACDKVHDCRFLKYLWIRYANTCVLAAASVA